jgi:uncharacterized membrane protein
VSPVAYLALALLLGLYGPQLGSGVALSRISSSSAISLLSSLASGMMALTGIVFSLVFVALQYGTSSYSPRLVRAFSGRGLLSHAFGVFSGTFVYALLAVRAVDIGGRQGVNHAAIVVGLVWLFASMAMLVLLIPHLQRFSIALLLPALGQRCARKIAAVYSPCGDAPPAERTDLGQAQSRLTISHQGRAWRDPTVQRASNGSNRQRRSRTRPPSPRIAAGLTRPPKLEAAGR